MKKAEERFPGKTAFIYTVILQAACALATLNNPNHLRHSKLIGIFSLAAFP
ncbi:hypothetical protein [Yersinia enterocolitica]|uniref:hypothetical protein n=1 Tax=Yersinia enterocolitica TaxID=630 RepID=UPI000B182EA6|nr:hypothetical protein [Yersinia enterocolitica]